MEVGSLTDYAKTLSNAKQAKSLVKKYLTPEVVEKYKDEKTAGDATLAHCIKSGKLSYLTLNVFKFAIQISRKWFLRDHGISGSISFSSQE
jgi:23S rRNA maturation-related 3'-5' exoribonuclease YhaM